jgi:hypothetical protein
MSQNHDALREALELGLDYAREALALHDQRYLRHPGTEAERGLIARHIEQIEQALAASKPEAQAEPRSDRMPLTAEKVRDISHDNTVCPVCGYYCLGKGGDGCIDKPTLCGLNSQDAQAKEARG